MGTSTPKGMYLLRAERRLLAPHTPAWFRHLEAVDPPRAVLVRAIVAAAGRVDVCSRCAAVTAPIYDQVQAPWLPWRLCPTCLAFDTLLYGRFVLRGRRHAGET
jgi:hypothetical protein